MEKDLEIIRIKYGRKMSKLCNKLFPQLLTIEGLLPSVLLYYFDPSYQLYNNIVDNCLIGQFKNYIYKLVNIEEKDSINSEKTPKKLLAEAGYVLHECTTEEEIQSFKKYYAPLEVPAIFDGRRLERCRVFFAVKKNVAQIRREDFSTPKRQDLYGTSVICIQFAKSFSKKYSLTISNRYNHHVINPDATFNNNLDNIVIGLTKSFEREYGIVQNNKISAGFQIPDYVKANDGRYYKYNYKIDDIYYCKNNVVIDKSEVIKFDEERYIIFDYFILDLQNKKILSPDSSKNLFVKSIGIIEKIEVTNTEVGKVIDITPKEGKVVKITLDQDNRMIRYQNDNVKEIEDYFLEDNITLKEIELGCVEKIGDYFLHNNSSLTKFWAPKLMQVGNCFLSNNNAITELDLASLEEIGNFFLFKNECLTKFDAPKLRTILACCFRNNKDLKELRLDNLEEVGDCFLYLNTDLTVFECPKLVRVGNGALKSDPDLRSKVMRKVII